MRDLAEIDQVRVAPGVVWCLDTHAFVEAVKPGFVVCGTRRRPDTRVRLARLTEGPSDAGGAPGTVPRPGTGFACAGIYAGNSLTCGKSVLGFQEVELLPAPKISLKAAMNRFISSGVPTDTRRCSTI